MSNPSDAPSVGPAREPATIRATLDAATCGVCRAGHLRRVDIAMPLSLITPCEHVANGTGICRCVAVLDGKVAHIAVTVSFAPEPAAPDASQPLILSRPEITGKPNSDG